MNKGLVLLSAIIFSPASMRILLAYTSPVEHSQKEGLTGIAMIREALREGSLTKSLVEEKICKASLEDSPLLMNFAREIKGVVYLSADRVLSKGTQATAEELENALAAFGILQWAGVETDKGNSLQIRLSVLLKIRSERSKKKDEPYETSI